MAERFVQSVKRECFDYFIVFGENHLRHILSEYLLYYHQHSLHQGLDNRPLSWAKLAAVDGDRPLGKVVCEERLGGLHRHYKHSA